MTVIVQKVECACELHVAGMSVCVTSPCFGWVFFIEVNIVLGSSNLDVWNIYGKEFFTTQKKVVIATKQPDKFYFIAGEEKQSQAGP